MIKVGLIGLGNVGKGILDILIKNKALLTHRVGQSIEVKKVAVRSPNKYNHLLPADVLTTNVDELLCDPDIDIVVEVMGGESPAFDYICTALKNKKHVVTANKEVIAKHKKTFFNLAKENGVDIYFEGAVAGGIPIIRSLKVGFAANKIEKLIGILNGTTNYILTKIEQSQKEFSPILKEAQSLGLAESDPTMDISGLDAAYKLVILAAVAFKKDIQIEDVYYEGIDTITLTDITRATELGYKIKLLAIGEYHTDSTMNFRVHTTLVHETHPLSTINNEVNAVYVVGNMVGEALLTGKGAGGAPTGSAVVSDIIDIAFDIQRQSHRNLETDLASITTSTIDTASPGFFLRIEVSDHSSVLEHISGILGKSNINISKILQKSISESTAEIIIITYPVLESTMKTVMTQLNDHPEVIKAYNYIRVLSQ